MSSMLRDPWWKRILAGDPTAIPAEWLDENGAVKLAGEQAKEFMEILEENDIEPTPELAEACIEYVTRYAIQETGMHPNGTPRPEWEEIYGE